MKLSKEEIAEKYVTLFPDKKQALDEHYADFNELLGHIFFADALNEPLIELIVSNTDDARIPKATPHNLCHSQKYDIIEL